MRHEISCLKSRISCLFDRVQGTGEDVQGHRKRSTGDRKIIDDSHIRLIFYIMNACFFLDGSKRMILRFLYGKHG